MRGSSCYSCSPSDTMVVIRGHFDGQVLVPDEPVDLPQNQPLVLHIGLVDPVPAQEPSGIVSVLQKYAGALEAPSDWASEHDHYIHGTPKRDSQDRRDDRPTSIP